ncbi:methyl-accepting chemotaxis protein [Erwinia sp. 9145]|uniref:methyl-accepting chemotaxis protein n=1 Tax=Erwinia sp. 9145 TaxID=1500895 RepID=UPI0005504606|nr:methyl-accepting chemotaxis protein [Erwinia sp. 9145]
MKILKNYTIRAVMLWILSLFCLLLCGVVFYSVNSLNKMSSANEKGNMLVSEMTTLSQGNEQYFRFVLRLYRVVNQREQGTQPPQAEVDLVKKALDGLQTRLNEFKAYPATTLDPDLKQAVTASWETLIQQGIQPQFRLAQAADLTAYHHQANLVTPPLSRDFGAKIEHFNQAANAALQAARSDVVQRSAWTKRALIAAVIVGALILLFTDRYLVVMVVRPLDKIRLYFNQIAAGDLSQPFEDIGKNCVGRLIPLLRTMQDSLRGAVSSIRRASEKIHHDAGQISGRNNDLSARTEQQAAALEQTAASMEQLSSTVKLNAENAQQASQLAEAASVTAGKGGQLVQHVVVTMKGIAESSHKIADITSVINSIAFQTNILALNASVEAARAGEQGRGFAVVASEVRNLAQRSANAAREIEALIAESVSRVDSGTQQVNSAGSTMSEMLASVEAVTDLMKQIAGATEEQSKGINQVGLAMTEMDSVTQRNASLVSDMAAAAGALEHQTNELTHSVAHFRLEEQASGPSVRVTTPRSPVVKPDARARKGAASEEWVAF